MKITNRKKHECGNIRSVLLVLAEVERVFIALSIQSTYLITCIYTLGYLGSPQVVPHDPIPAKNSDPAEFVQTNGPPESP